MHGPAGGWEFIEAIGMFSAFVFLLVVLDRYTGSWILLCHGSLGSVHARFLRGFAPAGRRRR
jgi:hypothetical protein